MKLFSLLERQGSTVFTGTFGHTHTHASCFPWHLLHLHMRLDPSDSIPPVNTTSSVMFPSGSSLTSVWALMQTSSLVSHTLSLIRAEARHLPDKISSRSEDERTKRTVLITISWNREQLLLIPHREGDTLSYRREVKDSGFIGIPRELPT